MILSVLGRQLRKSKTANWTAHFKNKIDIFSKVFQETQYFRAYYFQIDLSVWKVSIESDNSHYVWNGLDC